MKRFAIYNTTSRNFSSETATLAIIGCRQLHVAMTVLKAQVMQKPAGA
ncbi:MAG TPA: hypothetical protein VK208_10700 [Pyrinomonadaceae bacterium]|nr:hypothetical protein [Pyrinomonadaceae bacterium]